MIFAAGQQQRSHFNHNIENKLNLNFVMIILSYEQAQMVDYLI